MTDNGAGNGESEVVAKMAQKAFASSSNYENVRANYSLEAVEFFLRKLGVNWDNHDKAQSCREPNRSPFNYLGGRLWHGKIYSRHVRSVERQEHESDCKRATAKHV